MGDITPLKQENAHIYLKRMKESEEVKNAKLVGKTRSTGSSYEAGDETFLSGSGKKGRQAKQVKEAVHQQERRVQIHLQVQVMSYLNA